MPKDVCDFTPEEAKEILSAKLDYTNKGMMYLHCKSCLTEFLDSDAHKRYSAHEFMNYEASSYPLKLPNGKFMKIVVVWCKLCHRKVWDSRHLKPNL